MTVILRTEMRESEGGEPELWGNLGDVLTWLDTLPSLTDQRIAAAVAKEIRTKLFTAISQAEIVTRN